MFFMPWEETNTMTERMKFISDFENGEETLAELCRQYGIQRRIGYKWLKRFDELGPAGLSDRARAPRTHPNQTPDKMVRRILKVRGDHPLWGPAKIEAKLAMQYPHDKPPVASTIGEILKHEGLTRPRKKRRRTPLHDKPLAHAEASNDVLSMDFKGWFRTADGERIDPLTVVDNYSRYALCCQALDKCDGDHVQAVLARMFREYGLPRAMRSDNGAPFASHAIAGLSRLSVWLIKLGITVERIPPATPSANGRQERFHLTLQQHTAEPPQATRRAQQREFRRFCHEYNEERPHQALGQRTPASVYRPSLREYPARLPAVEYPTAYERRKVGKIGEIYWRGNRLFVSEVLTGEQVGLEAIDDGIYRVWFGPLELGRFDERKRKILPRRRGKRACGATPPVATKNP